MIRCTYDSEADALSIDLSAPRGQVRTEEIAPGVLADFDAKGRLVGIEVMSASRYYSAEELRDLPSSEEWLTLAEAAEASEGEITAATLRVQLNAKRIHGRKVGRDWQVTRATLYNYLENRAPQGRRDAVNARQSRMIDFGAVLEKVRTSTRPLQGAARQEVKDGTIRPVDDRVRDRAMIVGQASEAIIKRKRRQRRD